MSKVSRNRPARPAALAIEVVALMIIGAVAAIGCLTGLVRTMVAWL